MSETTISPRAAAVKPRRYPLEEIDGRDHHLQSFVMLDNGESVACYQDGCRSFWGGVQLPAYNHNEGGRNAL